MLKNSKLEVALLGGVFLLAFLFYAGCSWLESPTAPKVSKPGIRILRLSGAGSRGALYKGEPLYAEQLIEADVGGEVQLVGEYVDHEVSVPAGALSQDTIISIACPDAELTMVDLGPCGISFNLPVRVLLSWEGVEDVRGNLGIYWYDEEKGKWRKIPAAIEVYGNNVEVEYELIHFSRYALADE